MEFLLDTADLNEIEHGMTTYPVAGVTTNPTILSRLECENVSEHMRQIRQKIGFERTLHMQVLALDSWKMVKEAHWILKNVDDQVSIKVPVSEEGMKTIKSLKAEGISVTATAVFTRLQGWMAIAAGADYIAPYCNKIASLDIDFANTISMLRSIIEKDGLPTKILAAGFQSIAQVNEAISAGAHSVTVFPELLCGNLDSPPVIAAVENFHTNWRKRFGKDSFEANE